MKEYKRPVVLVNEELAEGVYAASGDTLVTNWGIWQKTLWIQTSYESFLYCPDVPDGSQLKIVLKAGGERYYTYTAPQISVGKLLSNDISAIYIVG